MLIAQQRSLRRYRATLRKAPDDSPCASAPAWRLRSSLQSRREVGQAATAPQRGGSEHRHFAEPRESRDENKASRRRRGRDADDRGRAPTNPPTVPASRLEPRLQRVDDGSRRDPIQRASKHRVTDTKG